MAIPTKHIVTIKSGVESAYKEEVISGLSATLKNIFTEKGVKLDTKTIETLASSYADSDKNLFNSIFEGTRRSAGSSGEHTRSFDPSKILQGIERRIAQQLSGLISALESRTGVRLGPEDVNVIKKVAIGAMQKAIPGNDNKYVSAVKEIVNLAKYASDFGSDAKKIVNHLKSLRKSDNKITIEEVAPFISGIKELNEKFSKVSESKSRASELTSTLNLKKDVSDGISKGFEKARTKVRDTLSKARSELSDSPSHIITAVLNSLIKELNNLKSDNGSLVSEIVKMRESLLHPLTKTGMVTPGDGFLGGDYVKKDLIKSLESAVSDKNIDSKALMVVDKHLDKLIKNLPDTVSAPGSEVSTKAKEFNRNVDFILGILKDIKAVTSPKTQEIISQPSAKSLTQSMNNLIKKIEELRKSSTDKESSKDLGKALNWVQNLQKNENFEGYANLIKSSVDPKENFLGKISSEVEEFGAALKEAREDLALLTDQVSSNQKKQIKSTNTQSNYGPPKTGDINTLAKPLDRVKMTQVTSDTGNVPVYPERVIRPGKGLDLDFGDDFLDINKSAKKDVEETVDRLASSLLDLQKFMVSELEKGFVSGSWEIVRESKDQPVNEYFELSKSFNKKAVGKQYELAILDRAGTERDIAKMNKELITKGMGRPNLSPANIKEFSSAKVLSTHRDLTKEFKISKLSSGGLREGIAEWMTRLSDDVIENWDGIEDDVKNKVLDIKTKNKKKEPITDALRSLSKEELEKIYTQTVGDIDAERSLKSKNLVKKVTLPAARLNKVGSPTFETQYGSTRAIPKFAQYKTGLENMLDLLNKFGQFKPEKSYADTIKKVGLKPDVTSIDKATELSEKMLIDLSKSSEAIPLIVNAYKKATVIRSKRLDEPGDPSIIRNVQREGFDKIREKTGQDLTTSLRSGTISIEEFIDTMKKLEISAYDASKGFESLEFMDIYQIFKKLMSGESGPLKSLGTNPEYNKSIRDYETVLNKMIGRIPIAESDRPRRSAHQENIVHVLTRTEPYYTGADSTVPSDPNKQKKFILDLNTNLREFIKDTEALKEKFGKDPNLMMGRQLPDTVKNLSSLGLPESQAAEILEYRKNLKNQDLDYLKQLSATGVKMQATDLTKMAPFGQFQQIARNIAGTTNALSYRSPDGVGTEFPTIRSEDEDKFIKSGRQGSAGYGFNVIAELRHTADTFEDQVVISGKLMDALTSITKTIVTPSILGSLERVSEEGSDELDKISSGEVTALQDQDLVRFAKGVEKINNVYQDVMGVKKEYKGRADKALLRDIQDAIVSVRGQNVNVQTAKIIETFFSHYGRKFTTRYGSKGVSIGAFGGQEYSAEDAQKIFGDKKVKLLTEEQREKAGLGTAVFEKSSGELLSEVFKEKQGELGWSDEELKKFNSRLVESGNKFVLSMATNSDLGVMPEYETKINKALYDEVAKAISKLDLNIDKLDFDVEGRKQIKNVWKDALGGEGKLHKELVKDIQISAYGVAKRGLQTEHLEMIMGNVLGTGPTGSTVLKTDLSDSYPKLLGQVEDPNLPSLAELSEAYGFERSAESKEKITKDLYEMFRKESPDEDQSELMDKARKLAEKEHASPYYSTSISPTGEPSKGLVGRKFVEIVEDPAKDPAWTEADIAKQVKGEKLNIPAFGAYSTVFGKDSKLMQEISGNMALDSKKHWEYIKALQAFDSPDLKSALTGSAHQLKASELSGFSEGVGSFDPDSGALYNSILNKEKYPGPISLEIPSTRDPKEKEDLYLPSAIGRVTYPEELMPGQYGMDALARRMQNIVIASKRVEDSLKKEESPGKVGFTSKTAGENAITRHVKNLRGQAEQLHGNKQAPNKILSDEERNKLNDILGTLVNALSKFDVHTDLSYGKVYEDRGKYVESVFTGTKSKNKPDAEAYRNAINQAVDQIIGPYSVGKGYENRKNPQATVLSTSTGSGVTRLDELAQDLGVTQQSGLENAIESLEKAKIEYYNALADAVLRKEGSVQKLFFNRKVPAQMAKAVQATVDRTEELSSFTNQLEGILKDAEGSGIDFGSLEGVVSDVENISKSHKKELASKRSSNLPVLRNDELGIPREYAETLQTDFTKKFKVSKSGEITKLKSPKKVSSDFAALLEYKSNLEKNLSSVSKDLKDDINKHINEDLQSYVETLRFPVTGISSLRPHKARLMDDVNMPKSADGADLGKHALMVPGTPEMDIPGIKEIKFKVNQKISDLIDDLDKEYSKSTLDTDRIEKLKDTIEKLDRALNDLIPQYTSQAQKLDFDGDAITAHTAKTKEARREIEQHFKSLNEYDPRKTTSQVYGREFNFDAIAKSTGPYAIAESSKGFGKKFPSEEGYEFLTKPFITEQLEYLKPSEKVGILSNLPGLGGKKAGPKDTFINLINETFRNPNVKKSFIGAVESVSTEGLDEQGLDDGQKKKRSDEYVVNVLAAVRSISETQSKILDKAVTNKLVDTKYANAVNAQLFKINTGMDTESLHRVLRVFESNVGFGDTGIRVPGKSASYNFNQPVRERFPTDLNVTGDIMGGELHTMMNELVRVAFQKGMDTKHPGTAGIAEEITSSISKGQPGAKSLIKKIKTDDDYKDLKEFGEYNEKALEMNMSQVSTEALREDAKRLMTSRGENVIDLPGKTRDELKEIITQRIGLEGFIMELSRQVQDAAYEGLVKSLKSLPEGKLQARTGGMDVERYAKGQIANQIKSDEGLNLLQNVDQPLFSMYSFRTSTASGYKQKKAYSEKYGDPETREIEGLFTGLSKYKENEKAVKRGESVQRTYQEKLRNAKAVSQNLQDAIKTYVGNNFSSKSSYGVMIDSTIENLRNDQKVIATLNKVIEDRDDYMDSADLLGKDDQENINKLLSRVDDKESLNQFSKSILDDNKGPKRRKKVLEDFAKAVGAPLQSKEYIQELRDRLESPAAEMARVNVSAPKPTEKHGITSKKFKDAMEEYKKELEETKDSYIRDAIDLVQSDVILRTAKTKSSEGLFVESFMPRKKIDPDYFQNTRMDLKNKSLRRAATDSTGGSTFVNRQGIPSSGGGASFPPPGQIASGELVPGGPVVDVRIVDIAKGIGLFLGADSTKGPGQKLDFDGDTFFASDAFKKSAEEIKAMNGMLKDLNLVSPELEDEIAAAKSLVEEMTGGLNEGSDKSSDFGTKFRASGLSGGSARQIDEIIKTMMGTGEPSHLLSSTSLIGSGIHAKLEDTYKSKGYEVEVPTKLDTDVGEVSGTIDVLKRDPEGKVSEIIDIKTIGSKVYEALEAAVERFREETGRETPTSEEIKGYLSDKSKPEKYFKDTKLGDVASQLNVYLKSENTGADASAHFFDRMDDELKKPIEIKFEYDEKRLQKDLDTIKTAREEIVRSHGGKFAPTASFEEAKEASKKAKKLSPEEIDFVIDTGKKYYDETINKRRKLVGDIRQPKSGDGLASSNVFNEEYMKNLKEGGKKQQAVYEALLKSMEAKPSLEGTGAFSIGKNLIDMHQRSKLYQQTEHGVDVSDEGVKSFDPKIQDILTQAKESGPMTSEGTSLGAELFSVIDDLKKEGRIMGKDLNKAWKAYRMAVGDYYVKIIEKAHKEVTSSPDHSSEMYEGIGNYKKRVKDFQKQIRRDVGKSTDIYTTDNNAYISPKHAEAGGVFMSTADLIKRGGDPLGDNEQLQKIVKNIMDIDLEEKPLPSDAIRDIIRELTGMDDVLVRIYTDSDKVSKIGEELNSAWDFSKLRTGLSQLKEYFMLQKKFQGADGGPPSHHKDYIDGILKQLTQLEKTYRDLNLEELKFNEPSSDYKFPTLIDIPKQLSRDEQTALFERNKQELFKHYKAPEIEGGAKADDSFIYKQKIFGPNKEVLENNVVTFRKFGDTFNKAGNWAGNFTANQKDLNQELAKGNKTFLTAIDRVVKWGAAATLVYGGISYIKDSVKQISEIEKAMAGLQMVMNPLTSNFDELRRSATSFAKEYGTGVDDVLAGMKIFAQQGLTQAEIVDRTRTATLAANVTTLSAKDATEALTAAMKVFKSEGQDSTRFLDAWSEVESKAAITAGDLASAINKSASAASNAGFTFDELNGVIAAIGSVTRQTGKEVGTSLRFIFRRLSAEAGPKALSKIGIKIFSDEGELESGFDTLSKLADKWESLTQMQKLEISQAIGGTRQYNQVLVLMDNWEQVQKSIADSIDSKGSAERKNLILMKTYAKQLERTKAVFTELKMEIGKLVLPTFKTALTGVRGFLEVINNIPSSIKLAGAGLTLFAGYVVKGATILDTFANSLERVTGAASGITGDFLKGLKIGGFELLGIGDQSKDSDLFGLNKLSDVTNVKSIDDLDSAMGKLGYTVVNAGRNFNEFFGLVGKDASSTVKIVGGLVEGIADFTSKAGLLVGALPIPGLLDEAVGAATTVASEGLGYVGKKTKGVGEKGENVFSDFIGSFASQNTGLTKSLTPLLATITGGSMLLLPKVKEGFKALTQTAEDYKKEQYGLIESNKDEVDVLGNLIDEYDKLVKSRKKVVELSEKDIQKEIKQGIYRSPLLEEIKALEQYNKLTRKLGKVDPSMITGIDPSGNYMAKNNEDLRGYLKNLEEVAKVNEGMMQLDIAQRFSEELIKTDGLEDFKQTIKEITESLPLIGEALSKNIAVGPAKALKILDAEIDKLYEAKREFPLSTAFDSQIKDALNARGKIESAMDTSYKEMNRAIGNINTSGLSLENINKLMGSSTVKQAADISLIREEKYNIDSLKGRVSAEDIVAAQSLQRVSSLGTQLQAAPELTAQSLLESSVLPRGTGESASEIKTGDLLILTEEFSEEYGIRTQQAIAQVNDANELFLIYMDKSQNKLVKKMQDVGKLDNNVSLIFSGSDIVRRTKDELTKLNTVVAGAAAGMVTYSDEFLKRSSIDLGEKFFSDISTNTLMQTPKGFVPITAPETGIGEVTTGQYTGMSGYYGKIGYKKNYAEDYEKYLQDPMSKYSMQLDQLNAKQTGGEPTGPIDLSGGQMAKGIRELQEVISNNSVVFQFRSSLVEMEKALESSTRTLKKNIEIEKMRQEVEKETAGLMAGTTKGASNIDLGVMNYRDLSPQQYGVLNIPGFEERANTITQLDMQMSGIIDQLKIMAGTSADVVDINEEADAFNRILSPDKIRELNETTSNTIKTGGDKGAVAIVTSLDKGNTILGKIEANTAATVDKLTYGEHAGVIERSKKEIENVIAGKEGATKTPMVNLNWLMNLRKDLEKNPETAASAKVLGEDITKLTVGLAKAGKLDPSFSINEKVNTNVLSNLLGGTGINTKSLVQELKSIISSGQYDKPIKGDNLIADYDKLQKNINDKPLIDPDKLALASTAVSVAAASRAFRTDEEVNQLQSRKGVVEREIVEKSSKGKSGEVGKLTEELKAIDNLIGERRRKHFGLTSVRNISGLASGALNIGNAAGAGDSSQLKMATSAIALGAFMQTLKGTLGKKGEKLTDLFYENIKETAEKIKDGNLKLDDAMSDGSIKNIKRWLKKVANLEGEVPEQDSKTKKESSDEIRKLAKNMDLAKTQKRVEAELKGSGFGTEDVVTMLEVYLAMALQNYINKSTEFATGISTSKTMAEQEQTIIMDFAQQNPELVTNTIVDIATRSGAAGGSPLGDLEGVPDSIILDVNEKFKESLNVVDTWQEAAEIAADYLIERMSKLRFSQGFLADITAFNQSLEQMSTNFKKSMMEFDNIREFKPTLSIGNVLKGFAGEIVMPLSRSEMSPQQDFYASASPENKEILTNISRLAKVQENYLNVLNSLGERRSLLQENLDKGGTPLQIEKWSEELSNLDTSISNTKTKLADFNKTMQGMSEAFKPVLQYQSAIQKLNTSMDTVEIDRLVKGFGGLGEYFSSLDKMFGGSHPLARQAVSPEQEYQAARVGIPLTNRISNQKDIERSEILSSISSGSLDGKGLQDAYRNLANLDEKYRRLESNYDETQRINTLKSQLNVFQDFYSDLESIKVKGDISTEQRGEITDKQVELKSLMKAVVDTSPGADQSEAIQNLQKFYRANIKTNALGGVDFETQMKKIMQEFGGDSELAKEITNPLSNLLEESNKYLRAMAEGLVGYEEREYGEKSKPQVLGLHNKEEMGKGQTPPQVLGLHNKEEMGARPQFLGLHNKEEIYGSTKRKEDGQKPTYDESYDFDLSVFENISRDWKNFKEKTASNFKERIAELGPIKSVVDYFKNGEDSRIANSKYYSDANSGLTEFNEDLNVSSILSDIINEMKSGVSSGWEEFSSDTASNYKSLLDESGKISSFKSFKSMLGEGKQFASKTSENIRSNENLNIDWLKNIHDVLNEIKNNMSGTESDFNNTTNQEVFNPRTVTAKAAGGPVFGAGGPREDKVPALLSPGEFVIRAHSAQRLGYSNLDHMNKKGSIPGFAEGGKAEKGALEKLRNFLNNFGAGEAIQEGIDTAGNKGFFSDVNKNANKIPSVSKGDNFDFGEWIKEKADWFKKRVIGEDTAAEAFQKSIDKNFIKKADGGVIPGFSGGSEGEGVSSDSSIFEKLKGVFERITSFEFDSKDTEFGKGLDAVINRSKRQKEMVDEIFNKGAYGDLKDVEKKADGGIIPVFSGGSEGEGVSSDPSIFEKLKSMFERITSFDLSSKNSDFTKGLDYLVNDPKRKKDMIDEIFNKGAYGDLKDVEKKADGGVIPRFFFGGKLKEEHLQQAKKYFDDEEGVVPLPEVFDPEAKGFNKKINKQFIENYISHLPKGSIKGAYGDAIRNASTLKGLYNALVDLENEEGKEGLFLPNFNKLLEKKKVSEEMAEGWKKAYGKPKHEMLEEASTYKDGGIIERLKNDLSDVKDKDNIRSFVSHGDSGIFETNSAQFDRISKNRAPEYTKTSRDDSGSPRLWGYDTTKGAQDIMRLGAEKQAEERLGRAMDRKDAFDKRLEDQKNTLNALKSINLDDSKYKGFLEKIRLSPDKEFSIGREGADMTIKYDKARQLNILSKDGTSFGRASKDLTISESTRDRMSAFTKNAVSSAQSNGVSANEDSVFQSPKIDSEAQTYKNMREIISMDLKKLESSDTADKFQTKKMKKYVEALATIDRIESLMAQGKPYEMDKELQGAAYNTPLPSSNIGDAIRSEYDIPAIPIGDKKVKFLPTTQRKSRLSELKQAFASARAGLVESSIGKQTAKTTVGDFTTDNTVSPYRTASPYQPTEPEPVKGIFRDYKLNNAPNLYTRPPLKPEEFEYPVFHNGGLIRETGPIFAEKGEIIIPKKFQDGGPVGDTAPTSSIKKVLDTSSPVAKSIGSLDVRVDGSSLLEELKSIKLQVEDKRVKVDNSSLKFDNSIIDELKSIKLQVESEPLKVEDKAVNIDTSFIDELKSIKLQVEDKTVGFDTGILDELKSIKLQVEDKPLRVDESTFKFDTSFIDELKSIKLQVEDKSVKIDSSILEDLKSIKLQVDSEPLKVEDKTFSFDTSILEDLKSIKLQVDDKPLTFDTSNLKLDADEAVSKLKSGVSDAINNAKVNIKVDSESQGGSVGADKVDALSEMISSVNDKLVSATTVFDDKIRVLESKGAGDNLDKVKEELSNTIDSKLEAKLGSVRNNIDNVSSTITDLNNKVTSNIDRVDRDIQNTKYLAHQALNSRNTGGNI